MTIYYDYNEHGVLEPVDERTRRRATGLRYLNATKIHEMTDGAHTQGGWFPTDVQGPTHYNGSDDLGSGVFNPADGKTYDSRSAYYKAVKDAGCVIVGDEAGKRKPKQEKIDWQPAVSQAIKQLKSTSPTRKGKKK